MTQGGRVIVYGLAGGEAAITNWDLVYRHQVHIIGLNMGTLIQAVPHVFGELMGELFALIGRDVRLARHARGLSGCPLRRLTRGSRLGSPLNRLRAVSVTRGNCIIQQFPHGITFYSQGRPAMTGVVSANPSRGSLTLADLTSVNGWVRARPDFRIWIPCPAKFPEDLDLGRDLWAETMALAWWQQSGQRYGRDKIIKLARMLRVIHEQGYEDVPCHQIWACYLDTRVPPLPLYLGIWATRGDRERQLRALSGAADPDVLRPPVITEFTTRALGTGIETVRHKDAGHGMVVEMLGFAFRSEEFETDIQVTVSTPDLRQLQRATPVIEDFIRGISVYYNPKPSNRRRGCGSSVIRQLG
jgi:hypothetical protein